MLRVLIAWVGHADLDGSSMGVITDAGPGPIGQAVQSIEFDRVVLLESFFRDKDWDRLPDWVAWLKTLSNAMIEECRVELASATDWSDIYRESLRACKNQCKDSVLTFHLSTGTKPMAAMWVLLAKTVFPAKLIELSPTGKIEEVTLPFEIAVDFLPDLLRGPDQRLRIESAADSPVDACFKDIIHRSKLMARLVDLARRVALRDVPVLLEGESGTGKELFAKAIHTASPRNGKPFVPVNCGAIPAALVESTLFGHEKGAFTDAFKTQEGVFEKADGGTLFLDELGDLPLDSQVKLLRVVQESKVMRLGSTKEIDIDVRIVSATNRNLAREVEAGRFREDLFYRLAVAVLRLPPLREREGDLWILIDHLLKEVNQKAADEEPGYVNKMLSAGARKLLQAHHWPGNIRQLRTTIWRAAIWSDGDTISDDDVRELLLDVPNSEQRSILGRNLGGGFDLREILNEVARHYLERAVDEAGGRKSEAAKLVGARSPQAFAYWLKKYGVDG